MTQATSTPTPSAEAAAAEGFVPFPAARADAYRAAGYWTGRTIESLLRTTAARRADHPAVIDEHHAMTYRELDVAADHGLDPGVQVDLDVRVEQPLDGVAAQVVPHAGRGGHGVQSGHMPGSLNPLPPGREGHWARFMLPSPPGGAARLHCGAWHIRVSLPGGGWASCWPARCPPSGWSRAGRT